MKYKRDTTYISGSPRTITKITKPEMVDTFIEELRALGKYKIRKHVTFRGDVMLGDGYIMLHDSTGLTGVIKLLFENQSFGLEKFDG